MGPNLAPHRQWSPRDTGGVRLVHATLTLVRMSSVQCTILGAAWHARRARHQNTQLETNGRRKGATSHSRDTGRVLL